MTNRISRLKYLVGVVALSFFGAFLMANAPVASPGSAATTFADFQPAGLSVASIDGFEFAPRAQLFPRAQCLREPTPDHPSHKHCEHQVKRAASVTRVKLLKRAPQNAANFAFIQSAILTTGRESATIIPVSSFEVTAAAAPFKAMFAITNSMLN